MRRVFLKTTIVTVAIFVAGFLFGIYLDTIGLEDVKERLTEIDNLWNDARLLQTHIQKISTNSTEYCDYLLEENLKIGDKIYEEGIKVERYEESNRFVLSEFLLEKRRYALLDLQFWENSMDLKKLCDANYSTVIYFYSQLDKTTEQSFQNRVLWDLKQKCGPKIIYITFPMDLDISTLNVIKKVYNIQKIPSILINESVVLESPVSMTELEEYVKC
jgi:hypothetical protein